MSVEQRCTNMLFYIGRGLNNLNSFQNHGAQSTVKENEVCNDLIYLCGI